MNFRQCEGLLSLGFSSDSNLRRDSIKNRIMFFESPRKYRNIVNELINIAQERNIKCIRFIQDRIHK